MLIAIDKRGSINLPSEIRKKMHLETGTYLDLTVLEGGAIVLSPVTVYPTVRLSDEALKKLQAARESGKAGMPE
ncbi:MAG: AbrB/MazE/SpoVT family DNA-binding domain-containing protein [Nitrospirales bacterium]|nr:AbrB/MazE/SpoVT family DNA-binding domain-containing protein [Nitrospirales bacterium]